MHTPNRRRMRALAATLLLSGVLWGISQSAGLARTFQIQLRRIAAYAATPPPHPNVILSANGANAYLAQDAKIPAAIRRLRLSSTPGVLRGQAEVDFSQLPHRGASGWAQMIFRGVHQIAVVARLDSGAPPAATVTVEQVSLDGERIPDFLIDLAIREFVTPKHPTIQGRTFRVQLPANVDRVRLGHDRAILSY